MQMRKSIAPVLGTIAAAGAVLLLVATAPQPVDTYTGNPTPPNAEILLEVYPWAELTLDGQELPVTPWHSPRKLAPGRHELRAIHPRFGTRTLSFVARAGELERIVIDLEGDPGEVGR